MELDYNQYYCSSNLPLLLRARAGKDDYERAEIIQHFVLAACDRALKRGEYDEWLRPTLLGAAFGTQNTQKAIELADLVEQEGAVIWQLKSTLANLEIEVEHITEPSTQEEFKTIFNRLEILAR